MNNTFLSFSGADAFSVFARAIFVYCFGAICSILLNVVEVSDQICLAVVHFSGAAALFIFWKGGKWGSARYDSFGAALILVALIFRLHALVDTLAFGDRIEEIARYPNVPYPENPVFIFVKAEMITVLAFMIVSLAWRISVGISVERYSFTRSETNVRRDLPIYMYGLAFIVTVMSSLFDIQFGPLAQIKVLIFTSGVASIYFIAARVRLIISKLYTALILAIPFSFLAVGSGMKEEIFYPFIPFVIIYWISYKKLAMRALLIMSGAFILMFAQGFVHQFRDAAWSSEGDTKLSTREIGKIFDDVSTSGDTWGMLDSMSSRLNLTVPHVIAISLADEYGHEPMDIFAPIPASLIPRFLWPNKPIMQPGAMHTARMLGLPRDAVPEIRSASAPGFAAELYLGGAWFAVVIGAAVYGWLMARFQRIVLVYDRGFYFSVFCYIALYSTLRFDEKHVVYAYTSLFFVLAYCMLASKLTRVFLGRRA